MAVGLSEAGQEGNTWGEEACLCFDRILSEMKCPTRESGRTGPCQAIVMHTKHSYEAQSLKDNGVHLGHTERG